MLALLRACMACRGLLAAAKRMSAAFGDARSALLDSAHRAMCIALFSTDETLSCALSAGGGHHRQVGSKLSKESSSFRNERDAVSAGIRAARIRRFFFRANRQSRPAAGPARRAVCRRGRGSGVARPRRYCASTVVFRSRGISLVSSLLSLTAGARSPNANLNHGARISFFSSASRCCGSCKLSSSDASRAAASA